MKHLLNSTLKRREFLKVAGLGAATLNLSSIFSSCKKNRPSPNIVLIMADDMGFSDIGCFGGEIDTPNLDRLAANGIRFTRFYNAARCCPTRASLLTGLYSHQAGMGWMTAADLGADGYKGEINKNCVTIAEVLRQAGYSTYLSGKWHLTADKNMKQGGSRDSWPIQRGFDRYFGNLSGGGSYFSPSTMFEDNEAFTPDEDFYYTDAISDNACSFVKEHFQQKEDPFFLYVSYTAPHWPLHAKSKDIEKYVGKYKTGWDDLRKARYEKLQQMGIISDEWELSAKPDKIPDWDSLSEQKKEEMDRRMAVYAAQVDCMDQGIGRLLNTLQQNDALENTVIFFLSDNGGSSELQSRGESKATADIGKAESWESYREPWANASNTPFRTYKRWGHEGGIATPLIVHWPAGISARGALRHQTGHVIDLMPTCEQLANAEYPAEYEGAPIIAAEGKSLVPAFYNREIEREALFWEHNANRAVTSGDWKLVSFGKKDAPYTTKWELYNLKKDRTETNDLAKNYPEIAEELASKWQQWAERANVLPLDGRIWPEKLKNPTGR